MAVWRKPVRRRAPFVTLEAVLESALDALSALLRGRRAVALTGAGLSTDSGIPDYRSPGRPPRNPIQHMDFIKRAEVRQRYWARASLGWPRFSAAAPNAGHIALARLESAGLLAGVITQNVDRLHTRAGSVNVVELHGALEEVRCLGCGRPEHRDDVQMRMRASNPGWIERAVDFAPDGDAELPPEHVARFVPPSCVDCDGALMPKVVFFGGNVDKDTLGRAWALFEEAELLLVVGSSLAVFSGYRFVRRAAEHGVPVVIVNRGPTRGDDLATLKVDEAIGDVLPALVPRLA